ncbi:hypothetical protein ACIQ4I_19965 [Rummeliibacillus sp. NPDC094406]|uniref:hypothetical protein n=1 Tax=Rummeliibacillus sp. NPDC094406 TaxID=3364511 RepID=UPI0037F73D58
MDLKYLEMVLIVGGALIGMAINITGNVVYHTLRIGMLFKNEDKNKGKGKKKRPPKK